MKVFGLFDGVAPKESDEVGVCDGVADDVDVALRVDVALFDDVREDLTDKVSNERADSVAIDETIASRLTIEVDVITEVDEDDKEFNDDTLDERET